MRCPVCNSTRVNNLALMPKMPLSVLKLPTKPDSGRERYPFQICSCRQCMHIFNGMYNKEFDQAIHGGCTMFNSGAEWQEHMKDIAHCILCGVDQRLGPIIEIGAGNGEFAKLFSGNLIAYEPSSDAKACGKVVTTRDRYFDAAELILTRPSALIMRHVLEHFADPRAFLEELAMAAWSCGITPQLFLEVPSIHPALETGRLEDWVYEHPQHFTSYSLREVLSLSGWDCDGIDHLYNYEVLFASAKLRTGLPDLFGESKLEEALFKLEKLSLFSLKGMVFWGGAGRAAVLFNLLHPPKTVLVVDSDSRKWGKFVPGTDQVIRPPSVLLKYTPKDILIATTWRTADIVSEIKRTQLPYRHIYNIVNGELVEYNE